MIRWIALATALIVACSAAMLLYESPSEPIPEPTIEEPRRPTGGPPPKLEVVGKALHQFDTLLVGGKGSHTWEFKNVGAGPLEVWLEDTTCSCTVASLKSEKGESARRLTIAPGRSSPIEVDWEARRPGRFGQAATIGTSDPDHASVVLSIAGTVLPPVDVRPTEAVTFPESTSEEAQRTKVTIVSIERPGLKLTKVATSRPGLIVADPRPLTPEELARQKAKAGYELAVEVRPEMPAGRFYEDLLVETDHPGRPSIKVSLSGNRVGPITVVPARVRMPSVAGGAGGSQDLALIVREDRETHFEVASKPQQLRVAISREGTEKPEARGSRYRLKVIVPPGAAPGLVDAPIVLRTDHPRVKEVRIPVSIFVSTRQEAG